MNAELRARILAEARRMPSPTRAEHRKRLVGLVAAGVVAASALFFAMGGVKSGTRPLSMVAFTGGFALLAAVVLTRLSGRRPGSMLPRPTPLLVGIAVATAPALALSVVIAATIWPEAALGDAVGARTHAACGMMTLVQGALPLFVLIVPWRHGDPVHPAITGAALGMAAGAWATTMAYLRCPHPDPSHCVIAHVAPTLVLTALGAVLGRALLRMR